jgi:hypothetical protein
MKCSAALQSNQAQLAKFQKRKVRLGRLGYRALGSSRS